MMPGNGPAIAVTTAGALFAVAGIKGLSVTGVIQDVIQGKNPKTAVANQFSSPPLSGSGIDTANTGVGVTPVSGSEHDVISAILQGLGAPDNSANQASIAAWIRHETPWPPVARYNPMNTTLNQPGATDFNSVGVKNFTSWSQGIAATVETLHGYPAIVQALVSGKGLIGNADPAIASELSTWSGGGYSSL